jgi:hypothetical protein
MPDSIRDFCGRFRTNGEAVGNRSPKVSAEGGGRREEVSRGDTPLRYATPLKQPHSLNLSLLKQGARDLKIVHSTRRKR